MSQDTAGTGIIDLSQYLRKDIVVAPVDPDWRKKYYRKVLIRRAVAFLLDVILIYALVYVELVILIIIIGFFVSDESFSKDWFLVIVVVLQPIFFILTSAFMESSRWQGTFGKRLMKLQITDKDGYRISFFRSVWRNFLKLVIGYLYCSIILLIIQIVRFRKTKKLFHDELSSTIIGARLPKKVRGSKPVYSQV